jgi:tetratricopeptide (TPR) repeat protein
VGERPVRRVAVAALMTALAASLCAGARLHDAPASERQPRPTATIPILFAVDNRLAVPDRVGESPGLVWDPAILQGPISLHEADRLLWARRLAATLVSEANRLLGSHLGVSFMIADVKPWSAVGDSLEARLDDLRAKATHAPGQILAGLTQALGRTPETGLASYREGLLVVALPYGQGGRLFAHELAHLFGALHLPDDRGLMAIRDPGKVLDPLNARLIELHRQRRFDPHVFPLPPEALGPARSAYLEAAGRAPDAYHYVGQICLELGDLQGALDAADRMLERDHGDVDATIVRGIVLRRLGRDAEAVSEYRRALESRPSYSALHYDLAIALDHLGQSDQAVASYERAVALDPANASAFSNLARLLARRGDAGPALKAARRAVELEPDFAGARVNLAMAWLEAGDAASAEAEARRAVAERPDLAEAHEALGAALLAGGRPETAQASFRRASELQAAEPRFREQEVVALRSLARSRRAAGDIEGAQAALEHATGVAPADANAWSERANLAFERGQPGQAREAYSRLLDLRPDDAAAHNNLALLLFRTGDVPGARRHVQEAQRLGLAVHPGFLQALAEAEGRN